LALTARDPFHDDLKRAASEYFAQRPVRDVPAMYLKAAIMLAWMGASYALLVGAVLGPFGSILAAISLGLAVAGVGMSVGHDANHGAMSRRPWVNRLFGATLDLVGTSSYVWRIKHNVVHHTYTNVAGVDDDLEAGPFARLSPANRRRRMHRIQHFYLWLLYGALHLKWVWVDDCVALATGRITVHPLRRPRRAELAQLVGGKIAFILWALVLPALFHPLADVIALHVIATCVAGGTLAVVFQLAHCVEEAETPAAAEGSFAAHQLATTVNFAPNNRLVSWYVGGLNFQVEHHLFPRTSHVHYRGLSKMVATVAERHGLRYRVLPSVRVALASHFRHLRTLGRRLQATATETLDSRLSQGAAFPPDVDVGRRPVGGAPAA
jgi:linoleoyl-CoA desaturase